LIRFSAYRSGPLIQIQGRFTVQQNLPHGQQKGFFPLSKFLIQFDKYPIHTSIVEKTWFHQQLKFNTKVSDSPQLFLIKEKIGSLSRK
jgi:hypothetical protein